MRSIALFLVIWGLSSWYMFHKGYTQAELVQAAATAQANTEARQAEQQHAKQVSDLAYELKKANDDVKTTKLRADVRSGTLRLSIPTAGALLCTEGAGVASRDRTETRAELDPKTADDLIAITKDGDDAIRQLNACIDAYAIVKDTK